MNAITNESQVSLTAVVQRALISEIERIIEEEAKLAAERTEKRVREKTAEVAAIVFERLTFEGFGSQLKITVDFDSLRK